MSPQGTSAVSAWKDVDRRLRALYFYTGSVLAGVLVWQLVALRFHVTVFPSPWETLIEAWDLSLSGEIFLHCGASLFRILTGFVLGSMIAVPIGLLMGVNDFIRRSIEPVSEFFRFIPAIAMVIFSIIWFGVGEASKVFLIVYNTIFTVMINTEAGVRAVNENQLRAASMMGARRHQRFFHVVVPATVPYVITGMRIAMGRSFSTIVAAELLGASTGLGSLISASREFSRMDTIAVGLVTLGIMGFFLDHLFRLLSRLLAGEYGTQDTGE